MAKDHSLRQQLIRTLNWQQGIVELFLVRAELRQPGYSLQTNPGILLWSLWSSHNEHNCHMMYVSHKHASVYQPPRPQRCPAVLAMTVQLIGLQQSTHLAAPGAQQPLQPEEH